MSETVHKVYIERLDLEAQIEALPASRERSIAMTYVETARLWFNAAPKFAAVSAAPAPYAVAELGREL